MRKAKSSKSPNNDSRGLVQKYVVGAGEWVRTLENETHRLSFGSGLNSFNRHKFYNKSR
jgi:hypothetical protein